MPTLRHLITHEEDVYAGLSKTTALIADGVGMIAKEAGIPMTVNRVGSMFTWFFTDVPVTDFASAASSDYGVGWFHRRCLMLGVWLPPSQDEVACTAHGQAEVGIFSPPSRVYLA